ncbi:MAG: hypothetical protein AAGI52_18390 [Bacteroidota bacterium]
MRSFDPSLLVLLILAALAAVVGGAGPVQAQEVFKSETTGLQVVLPAEWEGTADVNEEALPGRATYRFVATAPDITDATLIVERVTGLNPLVEARFRRGQVAFGYHGFEPTALLPEDAMVFGPAAGLAIEAGQRVGRVYFVQRGRVFWAVHVAAPPAALDAMPGLLGTLVGGVVLSDREVASPTSES